MAIERRLTAILAADVAGYSRLMAADEVGTLRALMVRRTMMDELIARHHGRVVGSAGDSVLAEFASVVEAVECALLVQAAIAEANAREPAERRMNFRIGVNLGDVLVQDDDLFGDGVKVAARLEALAEPGGICVSGTVYDQVVGKLEASFMDLGAQSVKNLDRPVRAWRVEPRISAMSGSSAGGARPALPLPDKPSLVVLPFQNMSADPEQEYFADGMTEEITTALSRIRQFFVIARNTAFTYKGKKLDVKQVGRELGVRYLLEGSVRKANNRVRITGQLIEADTGAHLWADKFDSALDDVFELQDRVTASVVGAIEPTITRAEIERATRKPPSSLQAYDLLLRAIGETWLWTREATDRALLWSREAAGIDPRYGLAHSYVAVCLGRRQYMDWAEDEAGEMDEGTRAAQLAAQLAGDDPIALSNAAIAAINLHAERDRSLEWINRALALNPNSAQALNASALVRNYNGDYAIAADHARHALRLSPFDPLAHIFCYACGCSHFFRREHAEAEAWLRRSIQINPHLPNAHLYLASTLAHAGRVNEAMSILAGVIGTYSTAPERLLRLRRRYRHPEDFDFMLAGARLAGLPE